MADGPGMTYLNGLVGHHGKNGCHLFCSLPGRHKRGKPHYYPALLKPTNYSVKGSDHPDIDINKLPYTAGAGWCFPPEKPIKRHIL